MFAYYVSSTDHVTKSWKIQPDCFDFHSCLCNCTSVNALKISSNVPLLSGYAFQYNMVKLELLSVIKYLKNGSCSWFENIRGLI